MELSVLIKFCKENYPEKAIEICEAIDLLADSLTTLKSDLGKALPNFNENNDWNSIDEYKNFSKEISKIIEYLTKVSNDITIEETAEQSDDSENFDLRNINYNNKSFNVDSKVPHTLYEDFTYTKPAGIKIEETFLEANEWRDIFNRACQYLYERNKDIFIGFLTDETMKGRSRRYFSYNPSELREAELITNSNVYLECNVNAIFVRNIIIKMLEKFEIPKRSCQIYIRRDLSSLHNNSNSYKQTTKNIEETEDEIRIGQYAKEFFTTYFQSGISEQELSDFENKDWCHDTFGICYPILKRVNIKLPISEQVNYNNQYRRYYSSPVLSIHNRNYIICSQWFSNYKPKLLSWINKNNFTIQNESNNIIKLNSRYGGITLPNSLFVYILKTIEQYQDTPFETGKLNTCLSDLILKQTEYEKPNHVINSIRKYLEDKNIISLSRNCKKGKYEIINIKELRKLINMHSSNL